MSTHANRVKMTVTSVASSGTGDITLNAASTGFRSFATAYGANATVDILITEGTAWEIARNCTYTHSGTTVSRGTLENSSTGSAVAFNTSGTGVVVSVIATAAFGNNAALNHVAGGDADTTMAVGKMYVTAMSAWATADRTYTLPADAAVGDRVGIMVTSGNASYELIIKPNTSDTINGGAAAAEWSRLFITGEVVILRCVTANSEWIVESDGRIAQTAGLTRAAAQSLAGSAAWSQISFDTQSFDVGDIASTSTYDVVVRRAGKYACSFGGIIASVPAQKFCESALYVDTSAVRQGGKAFASAMEAEYMGSNSTLTLSLAAGAVVEVYGRHSGTSNLDTGTGSGAWYLTVLEIL